MAFASTSTPSQAAKLGEEIYELILTNWGNRGAAADAGSIIYPTPGVPSDNPLPSVTGIAISPRSDVDRCVLSYNVNPLKPPAILAPTFYPLGNIQLTDQVVSVDRPWCGQMNGAIAVHADQSTWFRDGYLPAAAAPATFGTALDPLVFTAPTLRLLLFLRSLAPQPTRRSPLSYGEILKPTGADGALSEQLVKVLNVQGRRHIRIMLRGDTTGGGSTATVRIGGVASAITAFGLGPTAIVGSPECQLVAGTALAPEAATCVALDLPQIQFLTIYMSRAGAASVGGAYVFVEAID